MTIDVEGVWSISIPLDGTPIGSVSLYAIPHGGGVVLVDAGYDHPTCWTALERGLQEAGVRVADVTTVVLTHNHPDHVGLASRIRDVSGAVVMLPRRDGLAKGQRLRPPFVDELDTELRLAGLPDVTRGELTEAARALSRHALRLRADVLLDGGAIVERGDVRLRVLETPGHTRGHVCLVDDHRSLVFSGDLLLTTGEVQLGLVSEPADDPASDLRASLARVGALGDARFLPGHGDPFDDAPARSASAIAALDRRVDAAAEHVLEHPGMTAWERCERFPWGRDWGAMGATSRRFAVMQMMGWLRRAVSLGRARLEPGPPERTWP